MLNRVVFVLLVCLMMVSEAIADVKRIIVLEFKNRAEVHSELMLNISDQTRAAATDILSKDEYLIITRENMMFILQEMGKDASDLDGSSELEIARNLGVDFLVTGDLVKYDETYILTLKLYSTHSGQLLDLIDVEESNLLNLKKRILTESQKLFENGFGQLPDSRSSTMSMPSAQNKQSYVHSYDSSIALVIGIENYTHLPLVPGAVNDAKAMETYLIEQGFSVTTLLNEEATKQNIERKFYKELPSKLSENSRFVIYFAGHGTPQSTMSDPSIGYLMPVDVTEDWEGIDMVTIQRNLRSRYPSRHILYIADACYSGLAIGSRSTAIPLDIPDYLKTVAEKPLLMQITAGSSDQEVYPYTGPNGTHGLFTYFLLEGLKGEADNNNDSIVTTYELGSYLKESVSKTAIMEGYEQTPQIGREHEGEMLFMLSNYNHQMTKDQGAQFSLDAVSQANTLAEQSAKLERVIVTDLDQKERDIKTKASSEWNSTDFVSRRSTSPKVAVDFVNRFVDAYSEVTVEYSEEVAIPISVPLSRKVSIPEVIQARDWLRENQINQVEHVRSQVKDTFDDLDSTSEDNIDEPKGNLYTPKLIPAGTFTMGCTSEQGDDCYDSEKPAHQVTISRDFYLMESEVTQALYERVMGENPSRFKGSDRPVELVSWYDAVSFCNKLSQMEGLDQCYTMNGKNVSWSNKSCNGWRLPTEAEWEYAARGGQSYKYAGSNSVGDVAWYGEDYFYGGTHDVCGKSRNGYGLCDMSGNVSEWVWDWKGTYSGSPTVAPQGPTNGFSRVSRGGSWYGVAQFVRVSFRDVSDPSNTSNNLGVRLARNSP